MLETGIAYIYGLHTAPAGEGVDDSAPTWQLQLGEDASAYLVGYTTREEVERITGSGKVALERSDLPVGEHQIGELRVEVRGE